MTTVIKVENLGKKYLIGHEKQARYSTLRDSLSHGIKSMARRIRHPFQANTEETELEDFWALKDINFEIKQGDKVGIIGRNGAGKSTLLKILSRITTPTAGRITLKGRVASLLEVGTGFHPELSGRENIFLNGAILGMRKAEIKRKFDEIVAFAEVEKFLDTPVKRYSSGMYVRLAFAVAAHLEPEILIVDEVLAVGDAQFQKKCLGKMDEVSQEGRTILFVSHNMGMISNLCQKGMLLDDGKVCLNGHVADAIHLYYKNLNEKHATTNRRIGSENIELLSAELVGLTDKLQTTIHDEFTIRMKYKIKKDIDARCVPNFHFFAPDGSYIFISNAAGITKLPTGIYIADCKVPGNLLNEGTYFVGVAITTYFNYGNYHVDFFERNALTFNVIDPMDESNRYGYAGPVPGVLRPKLDWSVYSGNL
ncbi:MAG: ABC transporter ATP-binding protein [Methylomonas sp.]|nr:ABC transporter ATP-binding protein [Methylomonas sp.]